MFLQQHRSVQLLSLSRTLNIIKFYLHKKGFYYIDIDVHHFMWQCGVKSGQTLSISVIKNWRNFLAAARNEYKNYSFYDGLRWWIFSYLRSQLISQNMYEPKRCQECFLTNQYLTSKPEYIISNIPWYLHSLSN